MINPRRAMGIDKSYTLPREAMLTLPSSRAYFDHCSLDAVGDVSTADFYSHLTRQLHKLSLDFDVCVVDLSQNEQHIMNAFITLSDEVYFCERGNFDVGSWDSFKTRFLDRVPGKPGQYLFKLADRGALTPVLM